jgi:hypothetical protein
MLNAPRAAWAAWLAASFVLATAPLGCGGPPEIPTDQAKAIPVYNPSPDNKLKDVTLDNEYKYKDQIGGMSKPK